MRFDGLGVPLACLLKTFKDKVRLFVASPHQIKIGLRAFSLLSFTRENLQSISRTLIKLPNENFAKIGQQLQLHFVGDRQFLQPKHTAHLTLQVLCAKYP